MGLQDAQLEVCGLVQPTSCRLPPCFSVVSAEGGKDFERVRCMDPTTCRWHSGRRAPSAKQNTTNKSCPQNHITRQDAVIERWSCVYSMRCVHSRYSKRTTQKPFPRIGHEMKIKFVFWAKSSKKERNEQRRQYDGQHGGRDILHQLHALPACSGLG